MFAGDAGGFGVGRCGLRSEFGETEVENFSGAAGGDKNVGGLDIAVDDSFGVRGIESVGNLNADVFYGEISRGLPEMRCLRVWPSSNSMAIKRGRRLRQFRKWCRCWGDSERTRRELRAESEEGPGDRSRCPREEI